MLTTVTANLVTAMRPPVNPTGLFQERLHALSSSAHSSTSPAVALPLHRTSLPASCNTQPDSKAALRPHLDQPRSHAARKRQSQLPSEPIALQPRGEGGRADSLDQKGVDRQSS